MSVISLKQHTVTNNSAPRHETILIIYTHNWYDERTQQVSTTSELKDSLRKRKKENHYIMQSLVLLHSQRVLSRMTGLHKHEMLILREVNGIRCQLIIFVVNFPRKYTVYTNPVYLLLSLCCHILSLHLHNYLLQWKQTSKHQVNFRVLNLYITAEFLLWKTAQCIQHPTERIYEKKAQFKLFQKSLLATNPRTATTKTIVAHIKGKNWYDLSFTALVAKHWKLWFIIILID